MLLEESTEGKYPVWNDPVWCSNPSTRLFRRPHRRQSFASGLASVDEQAEDQRQEQERWPREPPIRQPSPKTMAAPTPGSDRTLSAAGTRGFLDRTFGKPNPPAQSPPAAGVKSRVSSFIDKVARRLRGQPLPGASIEWKPVDWGGGSTATHSNRFRHLRRAGSAVRKRMRRMRCATKLKSGTGGVGRVRTKTFHAGREERGRDTFTGPAPADRAHATSPELPHTRQHATDSPITSPAAEPHRRREFLATFHSRCSSRSYQSVFSFSRSSLMLSSMDHSKRKSWNPFNLPGPSGTSLMFDEDLAKYWHQNETLPEEVEEVKLEGPAQQVRMGRVPVYKVIVKEVKQIQIARRGTSTDSAYDSGVSGLGKPSFEAEKGKEDNIFAFRDQDAWWSATWANSA
ncbi:hypothetical protein GQ53DRAFT_166462 [Thozetella sp. PMI_491]|nr:hypothetical protein GQ53DRAFT_166462 [Thozetella sp. PMI_491]